VIIPPVIRHGIDIGSGSPIKIHSGLQTITVAVPGKPVLSVRDPGHLLDREENDDDNIERVESMQHCASLRVEIVATRPSI
jgi:hypothetical protein